MEMPAIPRKSQATIPNLVRAPIQNFQMPSAPMPTMKGQLNITNLVGLLVMWMLFFLLFSPIYTPLAQTAMAALNASWQFYSVEILLIELGPTLVCVAITVTTLIYGNPRYGQGSYGG